MGVNSSKTIDALYAAMDLDHDGYLSPDEILSWVETHNGFDIDPMQRRIRARELLHQMDRDHDHKIEKKEFKLFLKGLPEAEIKAMFGLNAGMPTGHRQIVSLIEALDMDHSGHVSNAELRAWLEQETYFLVNRGAATTLLSQLPADENGNVDMRELTAYFMKMPLAILQEQTRDLLILTDRKARIKARNQTHAGPLIQLQFDTATVRAGTPFSVRWSNAEWVEGDWIGLFRVGELDRPSLANSIRVCTSARHAAGFTTWHIPIPVRSEKNQMMEFRYFRSSNFSGGPLAMSDAVEVAFSAEGRRATVTVHDDEEEGEELEEEGAAEVVVGDEKEDEEEERFKKLIFTNEGVNSAVPVRVPNPSDNVRANVAAEIITSETTYVNSLVDLMVLFARPLNSRDICRRYKLKLSDMKTIFSNLENIVKLHIEFLQQLLANAPNVATAFLRYSPLFAAYTTYIMDYRFALEVINKLHTHEGFRTFLSQARLKTGGHDLPSFLILPVQRLPRYVLLLRELIHRTDQKHYEYESLTTALMKVEAMANAINEHKRKSEAMTEVLSVQTTLQGSLQLMTEERSLINQGHATIFVDGEPGRKGQVYLFNDLFLWADENLQVKGSSPFPKMLWSAKALERFGNLRNVDRNLSVELQVPSKEAVQYVALVFDAQPNHQAWCAFFSKFLGDPQAPPTPKPPKAPRPVVNQS
jgi:Ca2+-binding EF-hand superfamily protein